MESEKHIVLYPEWTKTQPIKIDDICVSDASGLEFLCSKIIKYKQFEYLYFGSFDFEKALFAVQYKDGDNYVKILTERPQQYFAYQLFKEEGKK